MFSKKCKNCNRKIGRKYNFCPFCGYDSKKGNERDYGLLGIDDNLPKKEPEPPLPFGMKGLMKILPKLMEKMIKEIEQSEELQDNYKVFTTPNSVKIHFSSLNSLPLVTTKKKLKTPIIKKLEISKEQIEKISKLPKKEAKASVRRLSDKIVYEVEVPGVDSINNVIINQLENSIEIKAISEKKLYYKNLNIKLPILRYFLEKEILILELSSKQ